MKMNWKKLLSRERLGVSPQRRNRHRGEFEEDFDNIVFSTAFRRLQGKTQVFGLSGSDYVRTRLTHSFEVACVGRSLGTMVENRCVEDKWKRPSTYGTIVAAACLAHDIGNPPFGHSGEFAIQQWFKRSKAVRRLRLAESQRPDIIDYEGNAQGFRILTKLQGQGAGLKLTYATLAAMTKYPFRSGVGCSKFGFFESERSVFVEVAEKVGLLPHNHKKDGWCRHPLALLVEGADDICNLIVDFEDAARLGILNYEDVLDQFRKLGDALQMPRKEISGDKKAQVEILSRKLLPKLTLEIANSFVKHEDEILAGGFDKDRDKPRSLMETLDLGAVAQVKSIQAKLRKTVFTAFNVVEIEVPAFRVLETLLETFVVANEDIFHKKDKISKQSRLLINFVPGEFRSDRKSTLETTSYTRLLDILDFVSGMTDAYAVRLYKTITGISLPGV